MAGACRSNDRERPPIVKRRCCAAALIGLASACGNGPRSTERPWCHLIEKLANLSGHDDRRLSQALQQNGVSFVLSGYDVFKGNPSPTSGSVDPGFQHGIFLANYSSQKTSNGKYLQPDGLTLLPCEGTCSEKSVVRTISGIHTYVDDLSTKVEFDIQVFGARFGASFDYQRLERGFTTLDEVYTMVEASCCAYTAQLDSFAPPPLTLNFIAAVEFMPVEYSQAAYFELIGEFGTHYVSSAAMGGVYGQETTFKNDSWLDMVSAAFEWGTYAQASFLLSLINTTAIAGGLTLNNDTKAFKSYSMSQQTYSVGLKPPASGKASDWINNHLTTPMPINSQLLPISSLFSPRFFANLVPEIKEQLDGPTLAAKQRNVIRALNEYCPDKLLPQGLVKSCATPPPDAGLPGPEKICLGQAWGGGGGRGVPFDDEVSLIGVNGLFSNLQVAELVYQSGPTSVQNYVQSIQLILQMGDITWPLKRHGAFGRPERIIYGQGTKITSVEVRYCSYVNSLTFYTETGDEQIIGGLGGCKTNLVNFQDIVRGQLGFNARKAWLVGLMGRSGKWVNNIGFYFAYTTPNGTSCPSAQGTLASSAAPVASARNRSLLRGSERPR